MNRSLHRFSGKFCRNIGGNLAVITGLLGLPVVLAAGYAVDYNRALSERSGMSAALDTAALAAVIPANLSVAERKTYAQKVFDENYTGNAKVKLDIKASRDIVEIIGHGEVATLTSGVVGLNHLGVTDRSKAILTKADVVCVLALDPSGERAIEFVDEAQFNSPACSVQVNSTHNLALNSEVVTPPVANSFCVGGISRGKFSPFVKHACTPVADPYENLTPPKETYCARLH